MSDIFQVIVKDSPEACAKYLESELVRLIHESIAINGRCVIALSGGSTPKLLYEGLAKLPQGAIDWTKVVLIWGDERDVPASDSNSNYRMVKLALLDHLPAEMQPRVLRIPVGEMSADQAARSYDEVLAGLKKANSPLIDITLLGLGDDAHTASLFPETQGLQVTDRLVISNWVEKLSTWRVTLTYDAINASKNIFFLVCGSSKTQALEQIWYGPKDVTHYPAQGISPHSGCLYWITDKAAVAGLEIPTSMSR
jgi:6-phosphogluconolactonase